MSFLHELAAGTVGGVVGITMVYPLDTAKMRLQTNPHYKGTFDVIKSMIRKEGATSLYRGLLSPQAGFGVTFAISFAGYGHGVRFFRSIHPDDDPARELTLAEMTLAGCWAGLLQSPARQIFDRVKSVIQSPARQIFERVKSVMQVQKTAGNKAPYRWSGECAVQLVRKEGLYNGLFRGLDATIAREIPQFAIYYPIYELLNRALKKWHFATAAGEVDSGSSQREGGGSGRGEGGGKELLLPPHLLLLAGGIAGTVQWLPPFYCIDVIKSRMQSALPGMYSSAWDCAVKSYRQEGIHVYFRGLSTALIRAFPLHATIFFGYESTIAYLKDYDAPHPPPPAE